MEDKIIKTKNSPQSISTIDQDGDNTIGKSGKPKSRSWWEKTKWLRWTLGIIVAAAAVISPLLLNNSDMLKKNTPKKEINAENSPQSINTIDQVGDNILNVGTQQRSITQDTKNQFSSILPPDKNQSIEVNSVDGDVEAFRFATQIKEYLESLGYSVAGVSKRIYAEDWTDMHAFTYPEGSLREIIVGRQP